MWDWLLITAGFSYILEDSFYLKFDSLIFLDKCYTNQVKITYINNLATIHAKKLEYIKLAKYNKTTLNFFKCLKSSK